MTGIDLASGQANGTADAVEMPRFAHLQESHLRTLYIYGTFDSADVTLEISPDNSNFFAVANVTAIVVKTAINVEFRGSHVQIVVANGLGSESISVRLI